MRHTELMSREECEVELNGALNRADHLRHRGQQVLNDAENKMVELQNQSKKSMDEVEVAAAAVIDMALVENDGTIEKFCNFKLLQCYHSLTIERVEIVLTTYVIWRK